VAPAGANYSISTPFSALAAVERRTFKRNKMVARSHRLLYIETQPGGCV